MDGGEFVGCSQQLAFSPRTAYSSPGAAGSSSIVRLSGVE